MVASEATPWAKSGGLADVLGALPGALTRLGHEVATVIPRYMGARTAPANRVLRDVRIALGNRNYDVTVWQLEASGPPMYFVDEPGLFDRPGIYGIAGRDFPDNHVRFAVLSKTALEISRRLFRADVIHCHDWQASLVPAFLKDPRIADPHWLGLRTLLTIHNLGYQGLFDRPLLEEMGLPPEFYTVDGVEFWGQINLLKAGIVFADAIGTVSVKYAEEIQTPEYGFGLDGLLRKRRGLLTGILNGADYNRWNPQTDPFIPAHYSADDLSGKLNCKQDLLRELGLPERAMQRPLFGIVSRFTAQKGFDLIAEAAPQVFKDDVYLAALGDGEARWQELFRKLQADFPEKIALHLGYDDRLAHRIEAGADIFLMPSRYEPCGLNQIYSLRYGTVPVVRATGGLDDTIANAPPNEATGFKFLDYNGKALVDAIRQASRKWADRKAWNAMMVRGMLKDFSWTASACEYSRLYGKIASSGAAGDSNF
ncbi:MAG: glycogen synthase GlgA [Acidobacteriota bacterium]|nr:glycogen synthase GlgA [Acidobacteriota bacterium]